MNPNYVDRTGDKVVLGNKFILYRNRSIPFSEIKEIRVKSNRFLINHFNTNTASPKMCIFFEDSQKAQWFHDEIINKIYYA